MTERDGKLPALQLEQLKLRRFDFLCTGRVNWPAALEAVRELSLVNCIEVSLILQHLSESRLPLSE